MIGYLPAALAEVTGVRKIGRSLQTVGRVPVDEPHDRVGQGGTTSPWSMSWSSAVTVRWALATSSV